MFKRIAAASLASMALGVGAAYAQTPPPNPTQRPVTVVRDQTAPIYQIVVVNRTTPAISYRPRHDDTKIDFAGTNLMPKAKGEAKISGDKGHMTIEAEFDDLEAPSKFGPEYLTYVLWAITPEGRPKNLGEVQVDDDDDDPDVKVTTDLQAFALILTAEPYFAVTQPSDAVVLENVVRESTKGDFDVVNAKYELLGRGAYLMNHNPSEFKDKDKDKVIEPGKDLDLAQARNAVELARFAGADIRAADTYNKAVRLLQTAEDAKKRDKGDNAVMMPARQAVQTAEDARLIALRGR